MKIVETLIVSESDGDVLAAHLAHQLNAGVDLVIAWAGAVGSDVRELLHRHARLGRVRMVDGDHPDEDALRASLAALAVAEHDADWLLEARADEFWLPRAASLEDVLFPVPARYTAVQGLVRVFPPRPGLASFAERMTARPSLLSGDAEPEPLPWALRPLQRAGRRPGGSAVPLRAWYPLEVLMFPVRDEDSLRTATRRLPRSRVEAALQGEGGERRSWEDVALADDEAARELAAGRFVLDERLRDVLRLIGDPAAWKGGKGDVPLPVPGVGADAAYAVECAAVGEVDLAVLESRLQALERRIARLDRPARARLRHRVARLLGR